MDCRDIQLLINLHLDGVASDTQQSLLSEHVACCKDCAGELALQERLSMALRNMGREEIEAPGELCGNVMSSLRTERRKAVSWMPEGWRKAVAAAATLLLLAGGSAGISAGLKMSGGGNIAGHETAMVDPGAGSGSIINHGKDIAIGTPGNANQPIDTPAGTSGEAQGSTIDPGMAAEEPATNSGPATASRMGAGTNHAAETRVMLSSGMKVTSTVIKVEVTDLTEARIKAVALAAGAGAALQIFPEQNGSKSILVMRNSVESGKAPELIASLSRLGALIDRQDESRDITNFYNETLVLYQDLQSRITLTKDLDEKRQLEIQAAAYKQQMDTWKEESGKRVIMLWLESK